MLLLLKIINGVLPILKKNLDNLKINEKYEIIKKNILNKI